MRVQREGITSGPLKQLIVVIYWIALPICLLAFVGSFATIHPDGTQRPTWLLTAGSLALLVLIGWRLWLHSRARMLGTGQLPIRRLLLIALPLVLLSLAGLVVGLVGLVWLAIGCWMAVDPTVGNSVGGDVGGGAGGLVPIVCGLVVLLFGALMNLPLFRFLKRQSIEKPSPDQPHDLEPQHD